MFQILYDAEGQMFEVPMGRARALLDAGWTLSFPEDLSRVFADALVPLPEKVSVNRRARKEK